MTQSTRDKYAERAKTWNATRPTTTIKSPTGQEFKVVKLEPFEVSNIWIIAGIKLDGIDRMDQKELGVKFMSKLQDILDRWVCKLVIDPKLIPSTEDPASCPEGIPVSDLHDADKSFLINEIMKQATGAEGKAKAESFPGKPTG